VYEENREATDEENYKRLRKLTFWGTMLYAAISVVSIFVEKISSSFFLYLQCAIFMCVGYIITELVVSKKKHASKAFLYLAVTVILTSTVVMGTIFHPESISAAFIGAIAILPSIILDRPSRITAMMILITVIFFVCGFVGKDTGNFVMDCINGSTFFFVGLFMMRHCVTTKMQNIIVTAQLEWRETRYRTVLSATDDIVFEFDPDQKSYYLSDNIGQYFDPNTPFMKLCQLKRVHPDERERYKHFVDGLDNLEKSMQEEVRFITKSRGSVWFEIHVTALVSADGSKRRLVGRLINIDGRKRYEESLKIKSQTDSATGLYNKAVTEAKISEALSGVTEGGCALLIVDIDNLKKLNDTLGHVEGDHAISAFATVLKSHFRESDIVGRVGGDEFMVLLQGIKTDEILDKIVSGFMAKLAEIRAGDDSLYAVGGSVGAALQTEKKENFEQLYKMADIAMYRVKKNGGKNGYAIYSSEIDNK